MIPCEATVHVIFSRQRTSQSPGGKSVSEQERGSYDVSQGLFMRVAADDGTGDYNLTVVTGYQAHPQASCFTFLPDANNMGPGHSSGHFQVQRVTQEIDQLGQTTRELEAHVNNGAGMVSLLQLYTTGHGDNLYPFGTAVVIGTLEGKIKGHTHGVDELGQKVNRDLPEEEAQGHYDLDKRPSPWAMEQQQPNALGQPSHASALRLSYKALHELLAAGKSGVVRGSEDFHYKDGEDYQVTGSSTLTLTIRPPKFEAIIKPVSMDLYNKWLPEGRELSGQQKGAHKARISFTTILRDKNTKKEITTLRYKTKYNLRDVSKEPGWCGNYPPKDKGEADDWDKPDLQFDKQGQPENSDVQNDGQQLTTEMGRGGSAVTVTSWDAGAYGKLQAEVTIDNGPTLEAKSDDEFKGADALDIPRDDNQNDIADYWERAMAFTPTTIPPTGTRRTILMAILWEGTLAIRHSKATA